MSALRITRTLEISAAPDRVWALLDDDENLSLWMPFEIETTYPDGVVGARREGTRMQHTLRTGQRTRRMESVITAYEPRHLVAMATSDGRTRSQTIYRIAPSVIGTRLEFVAEVEPGGLVGRLVGLFGRFLYAMSTDHLLARLKSASESGVPLRRAPPAHT